MPQEASLLPAECHLTAESFSVTLQCDLQTGRWSYVLMALLRKSTIVYTASLFFGAQAKLSVVNSHYGEAWSEQACERKRKVSAGRSGLVPAIVATQSCVLGSQAASRHPQQVWKLGAAPCTPTCRVNTGTWSEAGEALALLGYGISM